MSRNKEVENIEADLLEVVSAPASVESSVSFKREKVRQLQLENENLANANKHRGVLVTWMIVVVSLWLLFAAAVVVAKICLNGLSDAEMCALLTTTTANVLGLAVIVLKGLFRRA